jgi:hypothetical protein
MALQSAGVIKDLPMRSVPFLPQKVIAPDDLVAAVRATVRIPVNVTTDSGNVTGNSGERDRWVGVARFNFMPSCFFG